MANALPTLKERADHVTAGARGDGVVELIDQVLKDDLKALSGCLKRHRVLLGRRDDDSEQAIECYGLNVLVAGTSGSGKSTITTGILERLADEGYQFVVIDPEGDYSTLEGAVVLGDPQQAPTVDGRSTCSRSRTRMRSSTWSESRSSTVPPSPTACSRGFRSSGPAPAGRTGSSLTRPIT